MEGVELRKEVEILKNLKSVCLDELVGVVRPIHDVHPDDFEAGPVIALPGSAGTAEQVKDCWLSQRSPQVAEPHG